VTGIQRLLQPGDERRCLFPGNDKPRRVTAYRRYPAGRTAPWPATAPQHVWRGLDDLTGGNPALRIGFLAANIDFKPIRTAAMTSLRTTKRALPAAAPHPRHQQLGAVIDA